jgi:hypothetical protein
MTTSMRTRSIVAVLVVSAIAPAAPAAAGVYGPLTESPQNAPRNDSNAQRNQSSDYGSVNAIVPPVSEPSSAEPTYASANAITGPPASEPSSAEPTYASANAITGPPSGEPANSDAVLIRDGSQAVPFVANVGPEAAASAGDSGDGFDWGDAALGAGAAMAGLFGIGAAVLLATRRRTGMSPSTS